MTVSGKTTCLGMAGLLLLAASLSVSAEGETYERVPLNVGFGRTSFLTVNLADATAAFEVFTKSVGKKKGYDLNVVVHTYETDEEFAAAVTNQLLHLVIMKAWDYLSMNLDEYLEPRFLAIDSGYGPREYVLLVRTDAADEDLADLQGKHIILLENTNCEMSEHWVRTLLLEQGLGKEETFFERVEVQSKPTKVLLPVFFGKADACIVNRPVFDTMCELNPQIGQRLRSIAVSEPLADAVTFLAYGGWADPRYRPDLVESLESLHREPAGQQILTLFKSDRLAPFEEEYLAATRALKSTYDRLIREGGGQ